MKTIQFITVFLMTSALLVLPFDGKNSTSDIKKQVFTEKIQKKLTEKPILAISDSICEALGVPAQLVREIGKNESGWRCIKNLTGGTDFGDLQVVEKTFDYWYETLKLEGGKTRRNYLIVGITYLKSQHKRYGTWEKARFSYARGHWRNETTWTCLEQKFMGKIDWSQYDS
jgi:hypothetical protein